MINLHTTLSSGNCFFYSMKSNIETKTSWHFILQFLQVRELLPLLTVNVFFFREDRGEEGGLLFCLVCLWECVWECVFACWVQHSQYILIYTCLLICILYINIYVYIYTYIYILSKMAEDSRIIAVGSNIANYSSINWHNLNTPTGFAAYGQSKLCNLLHIQCLHSRWDAKIHARVRARECEGGGQEGGVGGRQR